MLQVKAHFHAECGSLQFSGPEARKMMGPFSSLDSCCSGNTGLKRKNLGIPCIHPLWHACAPCWAQSLAEEKNERVEVYRLRVGSLFSILSLITTYSFQTVYWKKKKKKKSGTVIYNRLKNIPISRTRYFTLFFFWNRMLATTVKTSLSCTCHVPYVQSVPTAAMDNGSSLFKVQEEDNRDY